MDYFWNQVMSAIGGSHWRSLFSSSAGTGHRSPHRDTRTRSTFSPPGSITFRQSQMTSAFQSFMDFLIESIIHVSLDSVCSFEFESLRVSSLETSLISDGENLAFRILVCFFVSANQCPY